MFKVVNKRSSETIVILDPEWRGRLGELRSWGRDDILICPGCKQPVYVRAGQFKRWHFAHKHLGNCPYGQESPLLLATRATLYEWLITKFPEKVTLEKAVDDPDIPRPIDCWVEEDAGPIAYWIIEAGMSPESRENLKGGFERLGAAVNLVFVPGLLSPNKAVANGLDLTTTARVFLKHSAYDEPVRVNPHISGRSLHSLDAETGILTTYRGLFRVHSPKLYQAGDVLSSSLSAVQVSRKTGEFVHPGEYDRLQQFEKERPRSVPDSPEHLGAGSYARGGGTVLDRIRREENLKPLTKEEGTCIFCHKVTTDWWSWNAETKACKCRACLKEGKS